MNVKLLSRFVHASPVSCLIPWAECIVTPLRLWFMRLWIFPETMAMGWIPYVLYACIETQMQTMSSVPQTWLTQFYIKTRYHCNHQVQHQNICEGWLFNYTTNQKGGEAELNINCKIHTLKKNLSYWGFRKRMRIQEKKKSLGIVSQMPQGWEATFTTKQ